MRFAVGYVYIALSVIVLSLTVYLIYSILEAEKL